MILREYRPSDFKKLCEADRLCFDPRLAYSPQEMAAMLEQPGALTIVAESLRGRIAAFVIAHKRRARAHIVTLDVLPRWRRQGLGRRLMRRCEKELTAAGVTTIRLETAAGNTAAQALYEALGYTCVRRIRSYYATGEDAWLMQKALTATGRPRRKAAVAESVRA